MEAHARPQWKLCQRHLVATCGPTNGYVPYAFASATLADGRVVIVGGEYNFGSFAFTNLGAVYDPKKNTWTNLPPPNGWAYIGDSPSALLPNGKFLVGRKFDQQMAILDPVTLTWAAAGSTGKTDWNAEEGYACWGMADPDLGCTEQPAFGEVHPVDRPVGHCGQHSGQLAGYRPRSVASVTVMVCCTVRRERPGPASSAPTAPCSPPAPCICTIPPDTPLSITPARRRPIPGPGFPDRTFPTATMPAITLPCSYPTETCS